MANNDYEAGLRGETVGHDTFSYSYQLGTQERERRARGSSGGDPVAGMAGGAPFAAAMVILAFCAFVVSFCTYPICGAATLAAFGIGAAIGGSNMNFVGLVFMLMVPCYIVYHLMWPLEQKMAKNRKYQLFRQYWRLVVGTFAVHTLGTSFHMHSQYPEGAPLSGYLIDWSMSAVGFFLLYLNSLRLDTKYDLEPIEIHWIERVLAPVLAKIIPPVDRGIRDTGPLPARTDMKNAIDVSIQSGIYKIGDFTFPAANLEKVRQVRGRRGTLIFGGIALFFATPVIVESIFGGFDGFFAQLFGVAGLVVAAYAVYIGALQKTPPGKIGGPFRVIEVHFSDAQGSPHIENLRFARPADEQKFRQAVINNRPAAPQALAA